MHYINGGWWFIEWFIGGGLQSEEWEVKDDNDIHGATI